MRAVADTAHTRMVGLRAAPVVGWATEALISALQDVGAGRVSPRGRPPTAEMDNSRFVREDSRCVSWEPAHMGHPCEYARGRS